MCQIDIELLAERTDCISQGFQRIVIDAFAPDFLCQPALCQESAGIENEYFQYFILHFGKLDWVARDLSHLAAQVNYEITNRNNLCILERYPKEGSADAIKQLS